MRTTFLRLLTSTLIILAGGELHRMHLGLVAETLSKHSENFHWDYILIGKVFDECCRWIVKVPVELIMSVRIFGGVVTRYQSRHLSFILFCCSCDNGFYILWKPLSQEQQSRIKLKCCDWYLATTPTTIPAEIIDYINTFQLCTLYNLRKCFSISRFWGGNVKPKLNEHYNNMCKEYYIVWYSSNTKLILFCWNYDYLHGYTRHCTSHCSR